MSDPKIAIKGIDLNKMPEHMCIIAALVKRLGGYVLLSDNEVHPNNFTGILIQMSTNNSMIIKAN
jgi:hypothetical protein